LYGADGFLDKPFELDDLTDKVREVLAGRESA
jgi:DNA-binding response OmpR family regulator